MKILHLIAQVPPHGQAAGRYALELACGLAGFGHAVEVLTGSRCLDRATRNVSGVTVRYAHPPYPFHAPTDSLQAVLNAMHGSVRLAEALNGGAPPDVVVAHDWSSALIARMARRTWGCPVLALLHDVIPLSGDPQDRRIGPWLMAMQRDFCGWADGVAVPSAEARAAAVARLGLDEGRVGVVPAAVFRSTEGLRVDRQEFRTALVPGDARIIASACDFHEESGVEALLDALPGILYGVPSARLVLIGDGPFRDSATRRIEASRLAGFVRILDPAETIETAVYRVADLTIFPAPGDASGIGALSAWAEGATVLGTSAALRLIPQDDARARALGAGQDLTEAVLAALEARRPAEIEATPVATTLRQQAARAVQAMEEALSGAVSNARGIR